MGLSFDKYRGVINYLKLHKTCSINIQPTTKYNIRSTLTLISQTDHIPHTHTHQREKESKGGREKDREKDRWKTYLTKH